MGGTRGGGARTKGGKAREGNHGTAGDGAIDSNTLLSGKYRYMDKMNGVQQCQSSQDLLAPSVIVLL
jgi:hypothetical protein